MGKGAKNPRPHETFADRDEHGLFLPSHPAPKRKQLSTGTVRRDTRPNSWHRDDSPIAHRTAERYRGRCADFMASFASDDLTLEAIAQFFALSRSDPVGAGDDALAEEDRRTVIGFQHNLVWLVARVHQIVKDPSHKHRSQQSAIEIIEHTFIEQHVSVNKPSFPPANFFASSVFRMMEPQKASHGSICAQNPQRDFFVVRVRHRSLDAALWHLTIHKLNDVVDIPSWDPRHFDLTSSDSIPFEFVPYSPSHCPPVRFAVVLHVGFLVGMCQIQGSCHNMM